MTAFTWNGSFPSSPSTGDTLLMNDMTYTRTSLGTWEVTGGAAITATGALNSGSITSGFGTINNGASSITTTGTLGSGALTATTIAGTTGTFSGDLMTGVTSLPSAGEAGTYLSAAGYVYSSRAGTTKAPHFLMTNNNGTAGSLSSSGTGLLLISSGTGNTTALTLDNSQNATFAGDVTVPVGSVGSPSLTFSGDTDTGIYRRTANTINIATGGVQRFEIDSAGNAIFAGAATVNGGLNVVGTNNTTSTLLLSNTSGTDNNWSFVPAYNAQTLAILAASTTVLTLNENKSATFAGDVSTTAGSLTIADAGSTLASFTRTSRGAFEIKQGTSLNGWTTGTLLEVNTEGLVIQAATQINLSSDGGTTRTLYLDNSSNATFAGDVVVGSTGGSSTGNITVSFNGATENGIYIRNTDTGSSDDVLMAFDRNGTLTGKITHSNTGTSYVTSSDYRLKENVVTDWDATTRLKQLKPSRFNFIADADTTVDGFLAHEAQAVVPECVTGLKDAMKDEEYEVSAAVEATHDDDGNELTAAVEAVMATRSVPDYQGIDQSKLVPLLVKTIQELEARITALEA